MIGKRATLVSFIAVVTGLAATSCGTGGAAAGPPAFTLSSPDVTADGVVPDRAIGRLGGLCDRKNRSISLGQSVNGPGSYTGPRVAGTNMSRRPTCGLETAQLFQPLSLDMRCSVVTL